MVVNNWTIISISHDFEILNNIVVSLVINQVFFVWISAFSCIVGGILDIS